MQRITYSYYDDYMIMNLYTPCDYYDSYYDYQNTAIPAAVLRSTVIQAIITKNTVTRAIIMRSRMTLMIITTIMGIINKKNTRCCGLAFCLSMEYTDYDTLYRSLMNEGFG